MKGNLVISTNNLVHSRAYQPFMAHRVGAFKAYDLTILAKQIELEIVAHPHPTVGGTHFLGPFLPDAIFHEENTFAK